MRSKKKKIFYLAVILSVALVAFLSYRAWKKKQNIQVPPSIDRLQKEEGIPVTVVSPQVQDLQDILKVDGTVEADKKAVVVSRIDQLIKEITVDEGDAVRRDQVVVRLEKEAITSSVRAARTAFEEAQKDFDRARALFDSGAISRQELDRARVNLDNARARLEEAEEALQDTVITSPLTGLVSRREKEPGELASKGSPILEIVDIDKVEVRCLVSETDIGRVEVGQEARVRLDAFPGKTFNSRVKTINPTAREVSRLIAVKIPLDNPGGKIKPGMYARVELLGKVYRDVITLPQESITTGPEGKTGVFTVCDEDTIKLVEVETGISREGIVQVSGDISTDCRVVLTGQDRISDGSRVRVIEPRNQSR